MADFSFSFQKGDNAPVAGASLANTAQLFLELYCISVLLCESLGRQQRTTGDQPETELCFTHSSINRLPCSLQTPCLWGWFGSASLHSYQLSAMEKKTSTVKRVKRAASEDVSCGGKKNHAGLPRPNIAPSFS